MHGHFASLDGLDRLHEAISVVVPVLPPLGPRALAAGGRLAVVVGGRLRVARHGVAPLVLRRSLDDGDVSVRRAHVHVGGLRRPVRQLLELLADAPDDDVVDGREEVLVGGRRVGEERG